MAIRIIVNNRCPICGGNVYAVQDSILKQTPHYHNVEMAVAKRGLKQYIHSSCWYDMIKNREPYTGKMYV